MTGLESFAVPLIAGIVGYLLRHNNVFGQGATGGAPPATPPPAHPLLAEIRDAIAAGIRNAVSQVSPPSTAVTPTLRSPS